MLPDLSGVDVCRLLTEKYNIPIVMLTARSSVDDKLLGLETGADDYITKPFDLREVIGRVKAILRRFDKSAPKAEQQEGVRSGKMLISEKEWSVMMDGTHVSLTPKEFELLLFFVKHPRQVFSREQLLARIWGYESLRRESHGGHPCAAAAQETGDRQRAGDGLWRGVQI